MYRWRATSSASPIKYSDRQGGWISRSTTPASPVERTRSRTIRWTTSIAWAVNLRGVFLGMKFQIPAMQRSGGGAIVNTASVAALTGPGGMSAYAASKHGVHGLTRVAAMENAARGIRVNAIAPGWTETPMVAANSHQNPRFAELARTAIPARRGADPKEISDAALWLASDAASYVVGQMLVVDGGMTIGGFEP
jgi:NAD(P)-dependent dehydrogenase (short-subunit alcohol dehydrogenase family)